jgi:hypothetical protein
MNEKPPTTSTLPLGSKVALAIFRAAVIGPVFVQLPLTGSNNSELVRILLFAPIPPAARTMPLVSSVDVCERRALFIAPAFVNEPVVARTLNELSASGTKASSSKFCR